MPTPAKVQGAGLGLRRALLGPLADLPGGLADTPVRFLEIAPENWMRVGGAPGRALRRFTEAVPFFAHGLSLSLGGPAPLDEAFLKDLKGFLASHGIAVYSEHLSYTGDEGHLYDLLPIPFTAEAVRHVAARIRRAQDILERRIAVENVSYYAPADTELSELEFIRAVLEEADCALLLDVNNVYVNSVNHGYDPAAFISALPGERIEYIHVAGHHREAEDLLIDTHGAPVVDPVWGLLETSYARFGTRATLLERDFDLPPLAQLLEEVAAIAARQRAAQARRHAAHV